MISKITILSFLAIIILNIIGFLCLLKFRLNDKNLVGIKGIAGHGGPAGNRGDVGEQADPIPCYENQENKSKMCNYFIDNREELKGAKGKDGIIGEDGIPNWDSNVLNYPDNTLKCDNVNGYRRNLKGACFKEKLISDRIRKMNRNDSRLFWNVYDDRWCRIKKQRNNETFDDWKKRSIKMLLGVNANNEDKKN